MHHVILDIETLSTEANAVILSIGACWFDLHGLDFRRETPITAVGDEATEYPYDLVPLCFRASIDIQSCLDVGMGVSGSTLKWWLAQDEAARKKITEATEVLTIREALNNLSDWIAMVSADWPNGAAPDDVCVWGNGPGFDNAIIANAFHRLGYQLPWSFRRDRCYRTFLALAEERLGTLPDMVRLGTFHDPLDDAITQAMHMQRVNGVLRAQSAHEREAA